MGQVFLSALVQLGALTYERGCADNFGYNLVGMALNNRDHDKNSYLRRGSQHGRNELGLFQLVTQVIVQAVDNHRPP